MNRRHFLGAVAAANLAGPAFAATEIEIVRARSPFDRLLRDIEPGQDEFSSEKTAAEISAQLHRLIEIKTLPYAPGVRGFSPRPARYVPVATGVSRAEYDVSDTAIREGLRTWLNELGSVRAARFFVLPEDVIRFEIAAGNTYRTGLWKQRWENGSIVSFEPIEELVTSAPQPFFADITTHAFRDTPSFQQQFRFGVNHWRARLDAATGIDVHGHNGIAAGDIDNDGFDEIYVCQPGGLPNRLYRNRGDSTFEDITEAAGVGVLDATSAALFLDLRNTGLQDLIVLRPDGPLLFLNQGQSRFRHQPGAFRFRTAPQGSFTGMAAADYNRDGCVDLYLCTYSFFRDGSQYRYPAPYVDARNGPPNFLLRNELTADGLGAFVDVTAESGLDQNNDRFSFAPAWCDSNGDGWPDLYVANDFGRNNFYRNTNGHFTDSAAAAGLEDPGDGMSAAWFDYDGDGRPDLYVSNMWSDAGQRIVATGKLQPQQLWKKHAKGNSLYRNRGDGTFEDTGAREGVEMGRWSWSSGGFDFDNDGQPEIFSTAGMLTNESTVDLESFFWRKVAAASPGSVRSEPKYEDGWNALSQAVHEKFSEAGRQPNVFYVRRGDRFYDFSGVSGIDLAEDSRSFAVTDLDSDGCLDLLLKNRLGPQLRVFRNNSAGTRRAIAFRLRGVQSNRDAIGAKVSVDGHIRFLEAGSGYLSQHTKNLHFGLNTKELAEKVVVSWPSGSVQEFASLPAGYLYHITEGDAEVKRTPFSTAREATGAGLATENLAQPADTWLLDPVPLPELVRGPAFLKISAEMGEQRLAWYAIFCRYLFDLRRDLQPPVWLLVDDQSRAHKICFSPPDQSDVAILKGQGSSARALPFPGKYYGTPARNYTAMGAAFAVAGYPEQALRYLEAAPQDSDKVLFAIGRIHLQAGRWVPARDYLQRGLTLAPQSPDGWNFLGAVETGEGNLQAALQNYEKAVSLRPGMTSAMINAGQAHAALGDAVNAERLFRQALEIDPQDAAAANQMGELLVRQRRDADAKVWFERSISARRDYAPAINGLGAVYARLGQTNDAIAAFRYGLATNPNEDSFYLNLASVYLRAGNPGAARQAVEQLLSRDPANAKAKLALRELESR